ncbi:MAG: choice-of-anchor Q domain-containing protein [Nanoarchaeota archaeon]|nr:choice-of-anchor Q domain-containing protein [Nanoarchaeota archaeon]
MGKTIEGFLKGTRRFLTAGAMLAYSLMPSETYADIHLTPGGSQNIAQAVAQAQPGEAIYLSDGTYKASDGNLNVSYSGKDLTITAEQGAKPVWDLESQGRALIFTGGHTKNNIIKGITFRNGLATYDESLHNYDGTLGGGTMIFIGDSSRIEDCDFENSNAAFSPFGMNYADGGAIDAIAGSNIEILKSRFTNNKTSHIGGAVHVGADLNVRVGDGEDDWVTKFIPSRALILNCNFYDNFSPACQGGGGPAFNGNSKGVVMNCLSRNNRVNYYSSGGLGGGIEVVNSGVLIANNTIYNNDTTNYNSSNNPLGVGGGINLGGYPYPKIINCVVLGNIAKPGSKEISFLQAKKDDNLEASNSYLGEVPDTFNYFTGKDTIQIGQNPGFVSPNPQNAEDFSLRADSSCVDAGTDLTPYLNEYFTAEELADPKIIYYLTHDFAGNPRVFGSKPDIGAFEFYRNAASDSWMNKGL